MIWHGLMHPHWLDFLHGIRAGFFWTTSLQRIFEDFGVKFSKTNRIFGILVKIYPNGKKKVVESELG